ncbi:uncharacterized protein PAC_10581 [Phialocephala subalpina]|uniref:6-phosphogluconolactonase n=1 Tax=Phialocephala subalpina TaxID=576137 RepID=A0A1L7X6N5_9HELO|nr:uncharacterized protein PAC_10581 [Phialocephala subalpina]
MHPSSSLTPRVLCVALQSRGLLTLRFDPSKNALSSITILDTNTKAGFKPGWLHLRGNKLDSMSREEFSVNDTSGGLFSFSVRSAYNHGSQPTEYGLDLINSVSSNGQGGVFVDVSRDGHSLTAANIDGSTVSIHPLSHNGTIGQATYIYHYSLTTPGPGAGDSQTQSNPHEAFFEPSGQFMFSPDRGADLLRVIDTRTYMYLVSEIDNTVHVFALDGLVNDVKKQERHEPQLKTTFKQLISTVGLAANRTAPANDLLASEVAISNDGRFCYVSNRDTTTLSLDNIAMFSVHPDPSSQTEPGHLVYLGHNSTYGKIPKHFNLSNDHENRYLAVGNEVSQSLVILERDHQSGFLSGVKDNISFGKLDIGQNLGPTAVVWG